MISILPIIQSSSLVSEFSIMKLSCRFSARHHPGQARDSPVVHLSPGTITILVLIFGRRRQYIDSSSCHILFSDAIFRGLPPYFSSPNILPKLQYFQDCSSQSTSSLFSYLIISNVKKSLLNYTMHKNIS